MYLFSRRFCTGVIRHSFKKNQEYRMECVHGIVLLWILVQYFQRLLSNHNVLTKKK